MLERMIRLGHVPGSLNEIEPLNAGALFGSSGRIGLPLVPPDVTCGEERIGANASGHGGCCP